MTSRCSTLQCHVSQKWRICSGMLKPAMEDHELAPPVDHRNNGARDCLIDVGAASRFTYEIPDRRPYPCCVAFLRRHIFRTFIVLVFLATAIYLMFDVIGSLAHGRHTQLVDHIKIASVPLVSLVFTWFHVWLALVMMFYPIKFYGCGKPLVPRSLDLPINGWQGIVPRKAREMSERCCQKMIGNICTIEEFADRIKPDVLWDDLQDVFGNVCSEVLKKIMVTRMPSVWGALPDTVKSELLLKVTEDSKRNLLPAISELKRNINSILDIKAMATDALANDPKLMVDIFQFVAKRELKFITHVAAVMGFLLGVVQVVIYVALQNTWKYMDYVFLPVSGIVLGYFTNWLALKMTFAPIWPHMICGGYLNIQGVFLKRQKEASDQLASVICEKVVDARAMLDYMFRSSPADPSQTSSLDQVLEIFTRHSNAAVDQSLGGFGNMVPNSLRDQVKSLKEDTVQYSLELLPQHTQKIEAYVDQTMDVKGTLSYRLAHIEPPEFEDIIHPIFKADEWILLFVGAVLGLIIGLLQAAVLTNVH